MVFIDNWIILTVLLLAIIPIFFIKYGIYRAIRYRKTYILKIGFALFGVIFFSIYCIYCRYIDQQKIAYYCIEKQCISIVLFYKNSGVNSVQYAKIYEGRILFRFQAKMKNYAELLMEDDILISKKLSNNKFIVYGSLPILYGNFRDVDIKEANGYIDRDETDYIISKDLKFNYFY